MLYGYTNKIYILDRNPHTLSEMDMLQLFASPAGRALISNEKKSTGLATSSLSQDLLKQKSNKKEYDLGSKSEPISSRRQRRSSTELYKEAIKILGLTCKLTDNCRCIDCQSNYFNCDDECADSRTEIAAGTPILLDHALSHPMTCSIQ